VSLTGTARRSRFCARSERPRVQAAMMHGENTTRTAPFFLTAQIPA